MAISERKLEFWAANKYNVILVGKHGVGKTAQVETLFSKLYGEQGKDWLYFSAATMDPWVDFIGVPKETTDADGNTFLELVRPQVFALDQVRAIFFDEFNRSPKKVRNAVMELMQFKSINGHRFHNLDIVWGAINPPDENDEDMIYDVERIDPAQLDRFHVQVELPYAVSKPFFKSKFGEMEGIAACDWWNSLSDNHKEAISPRRLDYAITCWAAGGDMKDILPRGISTSELQRQLRSGSYKLRLKKLLDTDEVDADLLASEIADENFYAAVRDEVQNNKSTFNKVFPLLEEEKMVEMLSEFKPPEVRDFLAGLGKNERVYEVLSEAIFSSTKKFLSAAKVREIRQWMKSNFKKKSVDKDGLGDDDLELLSLFDENASSNASKRSVSTEDTYYREQRMVALTDYFSTTECEKAFVNYKYSTAAIIEALSGFEKMADKTQYSKWHDMMSTWYNSVKAKQNMTRFVEQLYDKQNSKDAMALALTSNPKMLLLVARCGQPRKVKAVIEKLKSEYPSYDFDAAPESHITMFGAAPPKTYLDR